ncbi:hypothetical protein Syun_003988 [Stephania yunnanensis]|uniref:Uncharacterized protein n=1 Tax=Stephania yunnanensis TaxID=152371 RepID=A0AAP0L298_9MAGN
MDTVSKSSMAVSMAASEASPSSTTTTPRPTNTPSSAPPSPAASPSHSTPSSNLPRISSIPVTISPPPLHFRHPEWGLQVRASRVCFEVVLGLGLYGGGGGGVFAVLFRSSGELSGAKRGGLGAVGERGRIPVVDVFSAEDMERIWGFPKAGCAVVGGRWGFHGGRGDGDEVRLGLLKAR